MKYITLFIPVLLGCLIFSIPKSLTAQTSQGSYLKVHFKNQGSALFNYSGKNYRSTTIKFINNKNVDTTIVKHIDLDKPTIFSIGVILKNGIMMYKYIGFNQGDTISIAVSDSSFSYCGNDKRMILYNEMFKATDLFHYTSNPYTIAEYDNKKAVFEKLRNDQLNQLTAYMKENKLDSQSLQVFKNYIDLGYYDQLLAVNYEKSASPGWKHPDMERFDSTDLKNNLLFSINTNEIRGIFYYLIQYYANLNNKLDRPIFENISLLNSRFYKTKMLDGLIFDGLMGVKLLKEHRQILASLKDYMVDNTDESITLTKEGKITKEALDVKLIGYDGKTTLFDQLLKGDQKIIVLDFWASWCAPCIHEIPKLKEANGRLSKSIKFISISSDQDSKKWIEGCDKYIVKENSYLLSNISNNELLKFFGVTSYPTFVVITNKGEVLSQNYLRPTEDKFDIDLQRMLEAL